MKCAPSLSWPVRLLGSLLTLGACAGGTQLGDTSTPIVADDNGNSIARDFEITVYQGEDIVGGEQVTLAGVLSQGKPIILHFWGGLCRLCWDEMQDLQEVFLEYEDRVLLFGLDVGSFVAFGSRAEGRSLLNRLAISYPTGTTFDETVVKTYEVLSMPTTFLLKPDGEVFAKWERPLSKDKITELVRELINASGGVSQ